jgi:hypothetical protein
MAYLETVKKQSTYGHLPNFAILSKTKLYLPNSQIQHNVLGKWSLDWIDSDRYVLGFIQQDEHGNIIFYITACYEFVNEGELQLITRLEFIQYWPKMYKPDPVLSLIHFIVFDNYQSKLPNITITSNVKPVVETQVVEQKPTVTKDLPKVIEEKPKATKDLPKVIEQKPKATKPALEFSVCKTDKPDVYHVYKNSKYVSTCLIPNMKTSKYMQDLFENKGVNDMIPMDMKLHEKSGKYYPNV